MTAEVRPSGSTGSATAEVVAEGGLNPDAGVTTEAVDAVDASLKKIAATLQVSDELQEDEAFLTAAFARSVMTGILVKENQEIVAALSTASGASQRPAQAPRR